MFIVISSYYAVLQDLFVFARTFRKRIKRFLPSFTGKHALSAKGVSAIDYGINNKRSENIL